MLRQWLQEGADVEDGSKGWEDENGIVTWAKSTILFPTKKKGKGDEKI